MTCRAAVNVNASLDANRDIDRPTCSPFGWYHVTYHGNALCECKRLAAEARPQRLRETLRARLKA